MNDETMFVIRKYGIDTIDDYNLILHYCAAAPNSEIFSAYDNLFKENIEWDIVKEFAEWEPV
jgi:hypothetical protein